MHALVTRKKSQSEREEANTHLFRYYGVVFFHPHFRFKAILESA